MKNNITIIFLFLISYSCFAKDIYKDIIILKNGDSLYCNIMNVERNALRIESEIGQGIMLSSISFIYTNNETLVKELSEKINNLNVSLENEKYTINFKDADIPVFIPDEKDFMEYESASFGFSPNDYSTYGFNLTAEFPSLQYFIASFECSLGTKKDEIIFHNFNFGFGAGLKYEAGVSGSLVQLKYKNSGAMEYPFGGKNFFVFELTERIRPSKDIPGYIFISYSRNFPNDELFQDVFYAGFGINL